MGGFLPLLPAKRCQRHIQPACVDSLWIRGGLSMANQKQFHCISLQKYRLFFKISLSQQ